MGVAKTPSGMSSGVRAPLRHPLFLGALLLLVVNDHVLKGAALLPSWATGKLSDFAGLIVAPVVLTVALRALGRAVSRRSIPRSAERPGARDGGTHWHTAAIAMSMVTIGFVATELWQPAADLVAEGLGLLGVPSRLWADPTDLVALTVLPVTWHVLSAGGSFARGAGRLEPGAGSLESRAGGSSALSRTVFALALVACVATAPRPPSWSTSAYLVNRLGERVDVRIRWANVELSCPEVGDTTLSTIVSPDVLSRGVTFRVEPGATIPLDDWAALAARPEVDAGIGRGRPAGVFGPGCVIALLSVDGAPVTLVLWSTEEALVVPTQSSAGELPTRGRVEVVSSAPGTAFTVSSDLRAEAYDSRTTEPRCTLAGEVASSDPAAFAGPSYAIAERIDGADGCVRLDLEMGTRPLPFFVCAPTELVPFVAGDSVRIDGSDELGVQRGALVGGGRTLVLLRARRADTGGVSVIEGGVTLAIGEPDACGGNRLDCGSYVTPRAPTISGGAAGEDVRAIVSRTSPTGRAMRIQVARAEWVVAASPLCREGRDAAGPLLDAVVLYE